MPNDSNEKKKKKRVRVIVNFVTRSCHKITPKCHLVIREHRVLIKSFDRLRFTFYFSREMPIPRAADCRDPLFFFFFVTPRHVHFTMLYFTRVDDKL